MAKPSGTHVSTHRLGFIINTMDGNVLNNSELLKQIANSNYPAIVINQVRSPSGRLSLSSPFQVHNSSELGLSRGRNLGIQLGNFKYAILCDDDIELCPERLEELEAFLQQCDSDTAGVRTILMRNISEPWRQDYSDKPSILNRASPLFWRKIQKINSMELVLNLDWIREHKTLFNEQLGLGSEQTNGGEEVLFMHSAILAGGSIQYAPIPIRIHEGESSGEGMSPVHAFTLGVVHNLTTPHVMYLPIFWLRFFQKSILRGWPLLYTMDYFRGLSSRSFLKPNQGE